MRNVMATAALCLGLGSAAMGNVVYVNPTGAGNQSWNGALGMDFTVNSVITITSLGAYDSGQDGFANSITIQLFDAANTATAIATILTGTGTTGTLIGGSRFYAITPIILAAGFHGSIVASAFSISDMDANNSISTITATTDSLGGALTFTGSRYDSNLGVFPGTVDTGQVNNYQAGTFDATPTPEPGTLSMMALAGVGLGALGRKRKMKITA